MKKWNFPDAPCDARLTRSVSAPPAYPACSVAGSFPCLCGDRLTSSRGVCFFNARGKTCRKKTWEDDVGLLFRCRRCHKARCAWLFLTFHDSPKKKKRNAMRLDKNGRLGQIHRHLSMLVPVLEEASESLSQQRGINDLEATSLLETVARLTRLCERLPEELGYVCDDGLEGFAIRLGEIRERLRCIRAAAACFILCDKSSTPENDPVKHEVNICRHISAQRFEGLDSLHIICKEEHDFLRLCRESPIKAREALLDIQELHIAFHHDSELWNFHALYEVLLSCKARNRGPPFQLVFLSGCIAPGEVLVRDGIAAACIYWNGFVDGKVAQKFAIRMCTQRHLQMLPKSVSVKQAFEAAYDEWNSWQQEKRPSSALVSNVLGRTSNILPEPMFCDASNFQEQAGHSRNAVVVVVVVAAALMLTILLFVFVIVLLLPGNESIREVSVLYGPSLSGKSIVLRTLAEMGEADAFAPKVDDGSGKSVTQIPILFRRIGAGIGPIMDTPGMSNTLLRLTDEEVGANIVDVLRQEQALLGVKFLVFESLASDKIELNRTLASLEKFVGYANRAIVVVATKRDCCSEERNTKRIATVRRIMKDHGVSKLVVLGSEGSIAHSRSELAEALASLMPKPLIELA